MIAEFLSCVMAALVLAGELAVIVVVFLAAVLALMEAVDRR